MKMVLLTNNWCIVDDDDMVVAVSDSIDPEDLQKDYNDACKSVEDTNILVEDMCGAFIARVPDIVGCVRVYTNEDSARTAMREILTFLRGEADGS